MNKQLINKYKHEFDHWLNECKILYKHINSNAWWNNEPWDYSPDFITAIIINDEYVEFRKALAEGKTIQFNFGNSGQHKQDFPNVWKDLNLSIGILSDRAHPENYRIKPEPIFKTGDWVYIPELDGNPCEYREDLCCLGLKKWEPRADEWCWNYVFGLVKVICKTKTEGYFLCWNPWKGVEQTITIDEPFTGTLPTKWRNK